MPINLVNKFIGNVNTESRYLKKRARPRHGKKAILWERRSSNCIIKKKKIINKSGDSLLLQTLRNGTRKLLTVQFKGCYWRLYPCEQTLLSEYCAINMRSIHSQQVFWPRSIEILRDEEKMWDSQYTTKNSVLYVIEMTNNALLYIYKKNFK